MPLERLQKIIARAGVSSRRAAEQLILEGRVTVDGHVVTKLGARAHSEHSRVEVSGLGALSAEAPCYIAMHKPIHVVSTANDPEGRMTVLDVIAQSRAEGRRQFEGELPRVFPVGRLDFNAEGLILLTNDGALCQSLLHPRRHVPKTYMVKVRGRPEERALDRLRTGVRLTDEEGRPGPMTKPAEVRLAKVASSNSWLEMILFEGRTHQVKRMCDAIRHPVVRLIRTDFGGVEIGTLLPSAWRFLTHPEIKLLKNWQRMEEDSPRGRRTTRRAS